MSRTAPFQVVWSRQARDSLRAFMTQSTHPESRFQLPTIVQELDERLCQQPREVGEVYRIRGPIEEYLAAAAFLVIHFVVDVKRFLVLVRSCQYLSGHGV